MNDNTVLERLRCSSPVSGALVCIDGAVSTDTTIESIFELVNLVQ